MKLHPRAEVTQRADVELQGLLLEWVERHDLTWSEAIRIFAYRLASWTHFPVRAERHPDDDEKKADEA